MGKNIPAGYQLHITTWENDGDNYKTKIISGLGEFDLKFYIDWINQFKGARGNDYVEDEELSSILSEMLDKHPYMSETLRTKWTDMLECEDLIWEMNAYFLSNPDNGYDHGFVRAIDHLEVFLVPEEITNVTSQFV